MLSVCNQLHRQHKFVDMEIEKSTRRVVIVVNC